MESYNKRGALVGKKAVIVIEKEENGVKIYSPIFEDGTRIPWADGSEEKYFEAKDFTEAAITTVHSLLEEVIKKAEEGDEEKWNLARELKDKEFEIYYPTKCLALREKDGKRYCAIQPNDHVEEEGCPFQGEKIKVKLMTEYDIPPKKELATHERYRCLLFD